MNEHEGQGISPEEGVISPDNLEAPSVQQTSVPAGIETNQAETIAKARRAISTDRGIEHYEAVFGKEAVSGKGLTLDLAAGFSSFAEEINDDKTKVVRLDATYGEERPDNPRGAVAGLVQSIPFENDTFDRVISSFMMQHLKPEDMAGALREMIRVTKPGGDVMVFPLMNNFSKFGSPYNFVYEKKFNKGGLTTPTLVIRKDPNLRPQDWEVVVNNTLKTAKLQHGKLQGRWERWFMKQYIDQTGSRRAPVRGMSTLQGGAVAARVISRAFIKRLRPPKA